MCSHGISQHLADAPDERTPEMMDAETVVQCYDRYSAAVHGALLRVMDCDECAGNVLVATFVHARTTGTFPTLSAMLRQAFICGIEASGDTEQLILRSRIHAWMVEARSKAKEMEAPDRSTAKIPTLGFSFPNP